MPYKDKNAWRLKKMKNPEEWKELRGLYNKRFVLRNKLKRRAEELILTIQRSYLVQRHGSVDKMMKQITEALRLPYCWNMEDYDHALAKLNKVGNDIADIQKGKNDNANPYNKCVKMLSVLAPDDPKAKLAIAYDMFCAAAGEAMGERVDDREKSDINFLALLVTRPDGYYPKWFPDMVVDKLNHMLCREDLLKIGEDLKKCVVEAIRMEKERDFLNSAISTVDEEADEVKF